MKKNYFLIGCIAFPIIAIIAFFIGMKQPLKTPTYTKPVRSNSWLQITAGGMVQDYNEIEMSFMGSSPSVEEICAKVKDATFDRNIKGIVIKPFFTQISMTGLNEVGEALQLFKQSGKPVIAHLEMQSQKDYLLAAFADTIAMEPSSAAGLFMEGVQANVSFYKNLLDKLGLKVNVIKSGDYKGAGETFSRTSLSPETFSNIKDVLSDRYELLINQIAVNRNLSLEQVKAIFESRDDFLISADYALEKGLIDKVQGRDEFYKSYGIGRKQLLAVGDYTSPAASGTSKDKIAVCYLQGGISPQNVSQMQESINADKVQKIIEQVEQDKQIKAVVLRVNSPGGSALESEIIYRKLEELKSRLPVVVSMGGIAASGGYYISVASDYIMADPYTITGSIGVVQLLPDASGLSKKVGISNQTIAFGKYAGSLNLMNTPSGDLIASFQRNSDNVYREFKQRVVKYRKIDYNKLENLAGGRVWSAEDALRNGLIDGIGNLESAVMKAAELAELKAYKTVNLPQKRPYWEIIMEQFSNRQFLSLLQGFDNMNDLLIKQLENIFKPYSALCLMPIEID